MNVLLVNGSPREECTYTALKEIALTLKAEGIDSEIFNIGNKTIRGCIACGSCGAKEPMHCVFDDDICNQLVDKMISADGIIIGSPVYYAGINGALKALLDRAFYCCSKELAFKPAAAIASARRAGTTPTIDQITKYFAISQMPIVSSRYWPMVHGKCAEDVAKDEEGLQIMRYLARNMTWMLKAIEAGKAAGIEPPAEEDQRLWTNFIR